MRVRARVCVCSLFMCACAFACARACCAFACACALLVSLCVCLIFAYIKAVLLTNGDQHNHSNGHACNDANVALLLGRAGLALRIEKHLQRRRKN